ncbi:MAG: glycosyltransferase 87 family protein [Lachnospiraceae bacterium]|nr:glycosyltransferase 87 family protein [Lachnospiraceae bacterium]
MKIKQTDFESYKIFILVALVNIFAVFIALFISDGQFLKEIIWSGRSNLLADFDTYFTNASVSFYAWNYGVVYPGLPYLFYRCLVRITPSTIPYSGVDHWRYLFVMIILTLCILMITYSVNKLLTDRSDRIRYVIIFILLVSEPFAFAAVEQQNAVLYTFVMLLIAMAWRDSDSKVKKELALIIIAIAASFKLTPAVVGLLYLKEKRYKEAVRLLIYGIVLFFLPYCFLGGIDAFREYLDATSITFAGGYMEPRPETIIGVCIEVGSLLGMELRKGYVLGNIVANIYLIVVGILFFVCKKNWKTEFLLYSLMVIYVNRSYPYTLIYLFVPLLSFIKDKQTPCKSDYAYMCLIALIFTAYPIIRINIPTATFITNYFCLYALIIILIADLLWNRVRQAKNGATN